MKKMARWCGAVENSRGATLRNQMRISRVPTRIPYMLATLFVAALVTLALATQAGVMVVQRTFPAHGKPPRVPGAPPNALDIGPRDAAGPPIVLIHGASSNLEAMRRPLGDMLASRHRVILIDRPGHGWSPLTGEAASTPAAQGQMIEEALKILDAGPVILVVHSW